ncbi:MAG: TonB-dependent Receptor Plug Domain [Sphingomonas bacterium]|uniref:TonB-dependent receptor domain-containing protein n=1 Tax=Sphingomonas bacterium TaxID=1895847 RepID=UPI00263456E7|nr:TonB-dependent receptor [Sphingomonas bacterium]MDB5695281.1 TonB-dependent Receptor Plug Domain [Sphingomonas bacterium]
MMKMRSRLLATTFGAGALMMSTQAHAQVGTPAAEQTNSADATDAATDVVVTGSRIQRTDLTSASPIAVVSAEEFALSGAVNVEQVLNTLPQVLPGTTGFSNNPGSGAATLNLRNLGPTRTLVLVNGRRWMFYDTNQIVDLNTIPQFLISGVDVVTGGASAVYGSDAVAGVVNFRLRNNLSGIEAGTTYAITERGDARRYSADLAIGANLPDGRGNVTAFANYTRRSSVFAGARQFSQTAAGGGCIVPGSTADGTRLGTPLPSGIALATCAARNGEVGLVPQGSPTGPIATFGVGTDTFIFNPAGGGSRTFQDPGDLYNFNPVNYLQLPQERYLLGGYGNYKVTDGVEFYTELSYVNSQVSTELAPTPTGVTANLQIASPFFNAQTRTLLTQQDLTDATPGNGSATTNVSYRFLSAGSRNQEQTRQAFRVLGGVRGDLAEKLRYDAFYSYARTTNQQIQRGNVSRSRYVAALQTDFDATGALRCSDAAARAAGCVPINVFGSGLASQQAVSYVSVNSTNLEQSELKNAVASISGSLFNFGMGADDVAFAFGGEYRQMRSRYIPDTFLSSGDVLGFNAGQPTSGGYDVKEVFGELRVPLMRDGFLYAVELNGAARYSDYSLAAVGGSWTYTGGAEIAPIRDVRFRGQYSRAVRAPNVADLFSGNRTDFPGAIDPCSDRGSVASRTDALRNFCVAQGVPAANVFTRLVQPAAQIQADVGGNPNVGEETSDTYTVGAVISPSFIPRLNVTVDYYNIKVEDTIGVLAGGLASALSLCYQTIRDAANPICSVFTGRRSAQGALGQTAGGSNPQFLSANVGTFKNSGIDVQVDYNLPLADGRLSFFYLGTYLDKFRTIPISAIPQRENILEGTFGSPRYRHTTRVTYQKGGAQLSLRWRYEGKSKNSLIDNVFSGTTRVGTSEALLATPRLEAFNYFDLTAGVDVSDALTFNIGVLNLLDKKPPIIGQAPDGAEQNNTLPSFYDVLGRDFFVSARLRF